MRYYYSNIQKKVIPMDEYYKESEGEFKGNLNYSVNYSISPDGSTINNGLGCAQRDVKDKLKEIEGTTGKKFYEIGNEKAVSDNQNYDYKVNRDMIEQVQAKGKEIYG